MGEILGIGLTHYPGPLVPTKFWPDMLKQGVKFGMIPADLYEDKGRWPAQMVAELGDDGGLAAAEAHQTRLMSNFALLRTELDAFKPDLVVMWGDDQYENYKLDCVPPFCVGIHDEVVSKPYVGGRIPFNTAENVWGFDPDTTMTSKGHFEAGHGVTAHLMAAGYDVSWARVLRDPNGLAHSFSNTIVYLDYEAGGQGFPYPIVPIHVNCYGNHIIRAGAGLEKKATGPEIAPPSPSPERCFGLGLEVARYFRDSPWRVAMIGTSSWSHGNLTDKNNHMFPDIESDRLRLAELKSGEYRNWGKIPLATIEEAGQHEVLNWICLAGAMAELDRDAEVLDFLETHMFNLVEMLCAFSTEAGGMSVDTTLWVTLKLVIVEAKIAEWEAFFADMRARVAVEEPGTLMFDMNRVQGQPGTYLMIERYADQAAWDFHSVKQGERGVVPAMMGFAAGPPEFLFLEPVAGPLR